MGCDCFIYIGYKQQYFSVFLIQTNKGYVATAVPSSLFATVFWLQVNNKLFEGFAFCEILHNEKLIFMFTLQLNFIIWYYKDLIKLILQFRFGSMYVQEEGERKNHIYNISCTIGVSLQLSSLTLA